MRTLKSLLIRGYILKWAFFWFIDRDKLEKSKQLRLAWENKPHIVEKSNFDTFVKYWFLWMRKPEKARSLELVWAVLDAVPRIWTQATLGEGKYRHLC